MQSKQPQDPQITCPLLKLPPELRINIYELIFTDENTTNHKILIVFLADARAPSKNLLLTCQSLRENVSSTFTNQNLNYWTRKAFSITQITPLLALEHLTNIGKDEDFLHIKDLRIGPAKPFDCSFRTRHPTEESKLGRIIARTAEALHEEIGDNVVEPGNLARRHLHLLAEAHSGSRRRMDELKYGVSVRQWRHPPHDQV